MFACDLDNQHRQARSLEAFLVHMGIAWCNLFQAICERDGVDDLERQRDGRHFVYVDGERKTWDLAKMVQERLHDGNDPVRQEHRVFHRPAKQGRAPAYRTETRRPTQRGRRQGTILHPKL